MTLLSSNEWHFFLQTSNTSVCKRVTLLFANKWHNCLQTSDTSVCKRVTPLSATEWLFCQRTYNTSVCKQVTLLSANLWRFCLPTSYTFVCERVALLSAKSGTSVCNCDEPDMNFRNNRPMNLTHAECGFGFQSTTHCRKQVSKHNSMQDTSK